MIKREHIEALCVPGGDATVVRRWWIKQSTDVVHFPAPSRRGAIKAMCDKPPSCPIREDCTGKVEFNTARNLEFSKGIISKILFKNSKPLIAMESTGKPALWMRKILRRPYSLINFDDTQPEGRVDSDS